MTQQAPFRRAARRDGVIPGGRDGPLTAGDWREIQAYIKDHRATDAPFDFVQSGVTSGTDAARDAETIAPFAELGLT